MLRTVLNYEVREFNPMHEEVYIAPGALVMPISKNLATIDSVGRYFKLDIRPLDVDLSQFTISKTN